MAEIAELPRPGVEVIQEFRAATPTIIRPTLVPFVCGAAKEIVEVTSADGTLNAAAKLQSSYDQLPRVISQTSFPSPRGNIAEVDVEEESIKTFFQFGGLLRKLERNPGESFLVGFNNASRAAVRSTFFVTSAGLDLNGKILVLAIDVTARLNTTKDVAVTFVSSGGNLTPAQICTQINSAVGDDVATQIIIGSNSRIQIASLKYGSASSVTVRPGGSANLTLGFASASVEYRVEGSGFRAQDLSNNTTFSPWVEWSKGTYLTDGTSQSSLPTYDDTVPTVAVGFGFIDSAGTFSASFVQGSTTFTSGGLNLKVGDEFVADGSQPNNTAVVMKVETARFKLGIINAKLSTFDVDGNPVSAVYDQSNVNTLFASTPFAPRYAWFMAKNLVVNTVATAAELTGSTAGTAATTATIESPAIPVGSSPFSLAGLTLDFDVTVDGVLQDTQTFTFTGGPFANLAAIVAAVGTTITGVFAHTDLGGTKIAFSTDLTGAQQVLTLRDSSTALVALGFTAATEYSDTGTDVEFVDIAAVLVGGTQTFGFVATNAETFIVQISADGGATFPTTRTYTFATGTLNFANIGALVTELGTATHWAGGVLPTEFVISNTGAKLKITSTATGSLIALRIGSSSTAIGATPGTDLLFTSLQSDIGEENLAAQTLRFKLNSREKTYSVVFPTNSLVDAVTAINESVGWPVASIGGSGDAQLVLTSTLKGYASRIEVVDDSTSTRANAAAGFGSGNRIATGSGRPNPDFSIDVSGNVVLGAEILRSQLTGAPFDPGTSDIYIQYIGLRKDVSPLASDPGVLRISDVTTLGTVLSPLTPANPLGLGMFFMLLNAPGLECAGMGVDEVTAAAPFGTLDAFARVANVLESEEIYAIAPLTHDVTVHQMFKTHVEFMSGPEQKGERIVFVNPAEPLRHVDDVIASGESSESTATSNQLVVDVNPTPGIVDRGMDPLLLSFDDQVFVQLTVDGHLRNYLVSSVNGTLVTLTTTFDTGENTDDFFTIIPLTETVVNADWHISVRGTKLLIPGSTLPDKNSIAKTVALSSHAYQSRRIYVLFPDTVVATLNGNDTVLPGFYLCAGVVGMVARFPPQQGFTNLPMTGYTGVQGSNDTFSVKQLNQMAGGGTYIIIQEGQGAALTCRHQVSTDLTSIETRELSITKVVDFVAKFLRQALRNFIGTFNITQPFLDTLSTVIQAMLGFLVENGILLGGDLNNLIQSKDSPDTVLVDVTLDVPFPCNYIRLTLVI
jgi:hypothetical protein